MPVSHLDNSVAEILAFGLNEATGGSYSHLTTSEDQMLALLVSEITGQEYSHLTTGRETLWELLLTQAASDGITFDRNTQSNEQIAAIIANNVSAGGEEPYTTGAAEFDGATLLICDALACPNNEFVSYSAWLNADPLHDAIATFFVADPENGYTCSVDARNPSADGLGQRFLCASEGYAEFISINDNAAGSIPAGVWHHVLLTVKTDVESQEGGPFRLYIDDVDVTVGAGGSGDGFNAFINGLPFWIGGDGGQMWKGGMADFWFARESLLTGSDISEATRRKFISATGKPVDLGADGSTPTGTAPAIFLRRASAAAASTFGNNLGTGGAFAITGTLTNASTSPTD